MKILPLACRAITLGFLALFSGISAQSSIVPLAGEYPAIGALVGDQMRSTASFTANGGWLCWQDNQVDGNGWGIGARRLNSSLSGEFNVFQINQDAAGDQENPQVAMLKDGGAVFVWQGGRKGFQKIYARFISAGLTFQSGDILVNTYTNQQQINPSVAVLTNGNVVVTWQSYEQDGSMFGVYGRVISTNGSFVTGEFIVNQSTSLNQRDPRVAALTNGNFATIWANEYTQTVADTNNPAGQYRVGIYGRIFNSSGVSQGNEFQINNSGLGANPNITGSPDGGFLCGWSQRNFANIADGWDVYGRAFHANGTPRSNAMRLNSTVIGDQAGPLAAVSGTNAFFVWTSMGQDGSKEGIYGRGFALNGITVGNELRVNTTTISKQMQPVLASDGSGRFLVVWSSFVSLSTTFDLYAQRYSVGVPAGLIQPPAPYVFALTPTSLHVTWPEMAGYAVSHYELYMDGSGTPLVVSGIQTVVTNLATNSTHTFQLSYVVNGERAPRSAVATGKTWGADNNGDGLPDDWQTAAWGENSGNWPASNLDSDGDGASNWMEFLAGTNPLDSESVLRTRLHRGDEGFMFSWNTQPGMVYQLQSASGLHDWQNVGVPRFAYGMVDSVLFAAGSQSSFYRVIRLR